MMHLESTSKQASQYYLPALVADESTARLRCGPLALGGGVVLCQTLLPPAVSAGLLREATKRYLDSVRQVSHQPDNSTGRGGLPARALSTAPGGPVQDCLYTSRSLSEYLGQLCGTNVRPTGSRGSYSYYSEAGDFLDTHLDIHQCDVTLITVLYDDTDPSTLGGALVTFPDRIDCSLEEVRALETDSGWILKPRPGESVVLLGGLIPHRVAPLTGIGKRIISALCYEAF